jgi:hypothetical protein
MQAGIPETRAAQRLLVPFARLLPPFNLGMSCVNVHVHVYLSMLHPDVQGDYAVLHCNAGEGLIELSKYNLEAGLAEARAVAAAAASSATAATLPTVPQSGIFAYHVLGRSLLHLAAEAAAFFALVLLLERASSDGDPWAALAQWCGSRFRRPTGRSSGSSSRAAKAIFAAKAAVGGDLELTGLTNGHEGAALQGQGLQMGQHGVTQVTRQSSPHSCGLASTLHILCQSSGRLGSVKVCTTHRTAAGGRRGGSRAGAGAERRRAAGRGVPRPPAQTLWAARLEGAAPCCTLTASLGKCCRQLHRCSARASSCVQTHRLLRSAGSSRGPVLGHQALRALRVPWAQR